MKITTMITVRWLRKHFTASIPVTILSVMAIIGAATGSPTFGQETNELKINEPKLYRTDEILGDLVEPTALFSKLSTSSAYKEVDSYLIVDERSDLATNGLVGGDFPTSYTWMTPGTYHRPLYFEQVNLERYGTGVHSALQPALSAAHFFTTIPVLPYKMGSQCPTSTEYTLGHYRPGDCTPHQLHHRPWSWRGAGVQALFVTGMVFAAP